MDSSCRALRIICLDITAVFILVPMRSASILRFYGSIIIVFHYVDEMDSYDIRILAVLFKMELDEQFFRN